MSIKVLSLFVLLSWSLGAYSQKKLLRPNETVGIANIDTIVERSFEMYDKIYEFETKRKRDLALKKDHILWIEKLLTTSDSIFFQATEAKKDFKDKSVLLRLKATIHLQRAKRAIAYCQVTCEDILLAHRDIYED